MKKKITWDELDDYFYRNHLHEATLGRLMDEVAEDNDGKYPSWDDEVPEWVCKVVGI